VARSSFFIVVSPCWIAILAGRLDCGAAKEKRLGSGGWGAGQPYRLGCGGGESPLQSLGNAGAASYLGCGLPGSGRAVVKGSMMLKRSPVLLAHAGVLALALGAGPVAAQDLFAAIAFSASTGKAGASWNYATGGEAEGEAVAQCGVDDCAPVMVFGQCGAIAVGDGYGMGYAADVTAEVADAKALENCNGFTTNCAVTMSLCNEGS
jgi:hypothetical protein